MGVQPRFFHFVRSPNRSPSGRDGRLSPVPGRLRPSTRKSHKWPKRWAARKKAPCGRVWRATCEAKGSFDFERRFWRRQGNWRGARGRNSGVTRSNGARLRPRSCRSAGSRARLARASSRGGACGQGPHGSGVCSAWACSHESSACARSSGTRRESYASAAELSAEAFADPERTRRGLVPTYSRYNYSQSVS